jgi:signal transduction histidine kinase
MKFFSQKKKKHAKTTDAPTSVVSGEGAFFREVDIEFLVHELKDPVAVIETGLRTLLERQERFGELTPRQQKILERNLRNCRKARDMIHHLLEIGRSQAGCFHACAFRPEISACQAVMDAVETVSASACLEVAGAAPLEGAMAVLSEQGITVRMAPEVRDIQLVQDETKFRQIVGNLVKNALHHRKELLEIRVEVEKGLLAVEVTDDGPGIEPEDHQTVFERYIQVKECALVPRGGHGLGLAGARILARCMGGDITIRSVRAQGATFRFVLPLAAPSKAETDIPPTPIKEEHR